MSLSITADTSEQQRMERFAEMLFRVRRNTTAPLPKSEAEAVERVSEEMRHTLGVIATPGATAEAARIMLDTIADCLPDDCAAPQCYSSRRQEYFDRFMSLLLVHCRHHRSVAFYANRLCITQKYLSTIVKEISNRTPSQWIRDMLINEIAYQLAHTSCSIKEIAYDFNFPTISFFGKYFKSATGLSPKKYRLSLSEA